MNYLRLEPILARIKEKRSAILCPTIDSIDDKNMAYNGGGGAGYGIFTWSLFFTWGIRIKAVINFSGFILNYIVIIKVRCRKE